MFRHDQCQSTVRAYQVDWHNVINLKSVFEFNGTIRKPVFQNRYKSLINNSIYKYLQFILLSYDIQKKEVNSLLSVKYIEYQYSVNQHNFFHSRSKKKASSRPKMSQPEKPGPKHQNLSILQPKTCVSSETQTKTQTSMLSKQSLSQEAILKQNLIVL